MIHPYTLRNALDALRYKADKTITVRRGSSNWQVDFHGETIPAATQQEAWQIVAQIAEALSE